MDYSFCVNSKEAYGFCGKGIWNSKLVAQHSTNNLTNQKSFTCFALFFTKLLFNLHFEIVLFRETLAQAIA